MIRSLSPVLIWAIAGACIGAGIGFVSTLLYTWVIYSGSSSALVQHNASLGALVGLHLGLLVAYLRSYQDEAPPVWEVTRREPTGIVLAGLLLVYALCWIVIGL